MSKVEVIKPAAVSFQVQLTLEEAVLVAALLGQTSGDIGHELYKKLAAAVRAEVADYETALIFASDNPSFGDEIVEAAGL